MAKPPSSLDGVKKSALKEAVLARLSEQMEAVRGVDAIITSDVIGLGSLVDLQEEDGRGVRYFVLPDAGGLVVGKMVSAATVLQPDSVVGKVLLGKRAGDVVNLPSKSGGKKATILDVA